jgi:hypothetical protein
MTKPKPEAQTTRLQRLYNQRHRVDSCIKHVKADQRARARQATLQRVLLYGHLVVCAGLDGTPPDMLLGCLLEGAHQLPEPLTRQRWHAIGAQTLAQQTRLQALIRRLWPEASGAGMESPAVPDVPVSAETPSQEGTPQAAAVPVLREWPRSDAHAEEHQAGGYTRPGSGEHAHLWERAASGDVQRD